VARLTIRIDLSAQGAIGPGKIRLLELVGESGSISAAGRAMNMSYRRAWMLIDNLNRSFRLPVVETQLGGTRGWRRRPQRARPRRSRGYRALERGRRPKRDRSAGGTRRRRRRRHRRRTPPGGELELPTPFPAVCLAARRPKPASGARGNR
jgi:molybdate transport system regulatory protein